MLKEDVISDADSGLRFAQRGCLDRSAQAERCQLSPADRFRADVERANRALDDLSVGVGHIPDIDRFVNQESINPGLLPRVAFAVEPKYGVIQPTFFPARRQSLRALVCPTQYSVDEFRAVDPEAHIELQRLLNVHISLQPHDLAPRVVSMIVAPPISVTGEYSPVVRAEVRLADEDIERARFYMPYSFQGESRIDQGYGRPHRLEDLIVSMSIHVQTLEPTTIPVLHVPYIFDKNTVRTTQPPTHDCAGILFFEDLAASAYGRLEEEGEPFVSNIYIVPIPVDNEVII